MVKVKEDLTGKKFGRLTVLEQAEDYVNPSNKKRHARWRCRCECGNKTIVTGSQLKSGKTKSCGCLNREKIIQRNKENRKPNKKYLNGEVLTILTSKGEPILVDKEDFDLIKDYTWHLNKAGYVETSLNPGRLFMHRLLTNCPSDKYVDHINHNPADNRKRNLRIVTASQNTMNSPLRSDNKGSGITGVHPVTGSNSWQATICIDGKVIYLGCFKEQKDAIKIRKEAEKKYFGKYAYDYKKDYRNQDSTSCLFNRKE